ncbi:MAG: hypothetical protein KKF44_03475 [Nanoarchaeota archaeon]|nr:hypothetical protein [Nanoarchaeota archaeon]
MNISELSVGARDFEVTGVITDMSGVREFEKFGKQGRVCNATIKDDSGEVQLTLWNEEIDKLKEGDKVKIKNGYVKEWNSTLQLSVGKFGSMEILE